MASEAIDVDQKFTQQTSPPEIVVNSGKAQTGTDAEVEGGTSAVGGTVASKWITGIVMTLGLVAVGASVGVYVAVDNMNSDNVEWQDTIFATIERGCRDSAGNWRNMERREGQAERHEGHFLMGKTAWMGGTDGIVTTDICIHQGDDYYMVEWGDGVTSSSGMSRDHGNRIVEVYTTEKIYRVFDIKDDSGSYCMIESIHWEALTGTPSTAAEARKFDLEEISALLNSLSDVDNLRNRISYLMTYVPPDPIAPGVDLGDSDLGIPGFPEDLDGGDAGWYNPSDSWFVPGDSGGNINDGGVDLSIDALLMQQAELMAEVNMDSFPHYTDEERVQYFLDQLMSQMSGTQQRVRRSSNSLLYTNVVYEILKEVTSNGDLRHLIDNHIDEVCGSSSTLYFVEKGVENSVLPSDCTMSYSFYYSDTIGQTDDGSLSRQKRFSQFPSPVLPPIVPPSLINGTDENIYEVSNEEQQDNDLSFLLSNEAALADMASDIYELRNSLTRPDDNLAFSVLMQVERQFGADFYRMHFC